MSGNEGPANRQSETIWYELVDPATDRVVGRVTRAGEVRSGDPEIEQRVRSAFNRELLLRDDALAEELGVCFADIETVLPGDTSHRDLVFRNLGVLTGLIPAPRHSADSPE